LKQVTQKSQKPRVLALNIRHRLGEGGLILLFAVAVYLLIALITYHTSDPGWSSSGTGALVANEGGPVGAWFADVLLYLFGYMAYLFPILFVFAGWFVFCRQRDEERFKLRHALLRFSGFILVLISGAGLSTLYLNRWQDLLPLSAGGVFGNAVDLYFINILSVVGTSLILITFFLVGITLFANVSWLSLSSTIGKAVLASCRAVLATCSWIHNCYSSWRDRIREQKETFYPEEKSEVIPTPLRREAVYETKSPIEKSTSIASKPKKIKKARVLTSSASGRLPSLSLLDKPQKMRQCGYSPSQLEDMSRKIEIKLADFDIEARVVGVHPGPVITRFELELAPGLKVNRITSLVKDLARSLSLSSVRVVEVIPGKAVIGLEVPNEQRQIVCLQELFESQQYSDATSPVSLAIGKDIAGCSVVVNLAKMPHLLVSGTTGSGKSISINAMIFSILFKSTPEEVRLIMIDPKMLELSIYTGIPHLLTPVVTDMKEAANAFRWCIAEMERRFQLMAALSVRNLAAYNAKVNGAIKNGNPILDPLVSEEMQAEEPQTLESLPCIVVVVDELADMMMVVGKKVEELIARIAQKARAAGIHMILATQRPSVDVITGLIKSNIPTRIAFQVSSKIDSRTILDRAGAEQLLGYGDMLYLPPGAGVPVRVHGAYVSDGELHRVIADWKKRGEPEYLEEVIQESSEINDNGFVEGAGEEQDPLYDQAVFIVTESRRASISYVQRRLKIGYNRAAGIVEEMEKTGVVSVMENNGAREVLAPPPPSEE